MKYYCFPSLIQSVKIIFICCLTFVFAPIMIKRNLYEYNSASIKKGDTLCLKNFPFTCIRNRVSNKHINNRKCCFNAIKIGKNAENVCLLFRYYYKTHILNTLFDILRNFSFRLT